MTAGAASRLALALLSGAGDCACVASTRPPALETLRGRSLPFRAILQGYPAPDDPVFWDRKSWSARLSEWSREGLNAVVWCSLLVISFALGIAIFSRRYA